MPNKSFVVVAPNPCSGTFVLPGKIAPLDLMLDTMLSSLEGIKFANIWEPCVVLTSLISFKSFTPTGIP